MLEQATGTSHAKVILIGEHSVVYHQPAIALPLPAINITATLTKRAAGQLIISNEHSGELSEMSEAYEGIRQLITRLLRNFNAAELSFTLRIDSLIPQERGMGSSAASAVAIIRAFFNFFEVELPDVELQRWANVEEMITHGSPSGIDAATTAHNKPVWFVKGLQPETIPMNLDATLILADTGVHGQTGLAVSVVRETLETNAQIAQPAIDALGELTRAAGVALEKNQVAELGAILNQAQTHLETLGVSHPKLDLLIAAARQAGALGAKLTGGGVGGAMIALTKTPAQTSAVIAALETVGAREIWTQQYTTTQ